MNNCIIKDKKLLSLIYIPLKCTSDNILPEGIEIIGKESCAKNASISSIKIPEGVLKIESGAFYGCKNLKQVYLPESCVNVEDGCFADCENLEFIHYGKHTHFGTQCFSGCKKLRWIEQDKIKARTFYFPRHNSFAITILQPSLSTNEYNIYAGRFADTHFPTGQPDATKPLLYFAEIDDKYSWYDPNIEYAIEGARYQKSGLPLSAYYNKTFTLETYISSHEFFMMMGICYEGQHIWDLFVKEQGYTPTDKVPIKMIFDLMKPLSQKLYNRFSYVIEHQDESINLLDLSNGFLWNDLEILSKK